MESRTLAIARVAVAQAVEEAAAAQLADQPLASRAAHSRAEHKRSVPGAHFIIAHFTINYRVNRGLKWRLIGATGSHTASTFSALCEHSDRFVRRE